MKSLNLYLLTKFLLIFCEVLIEEDVDGICSFQFLVVFYLNLWINFAFEVQPMPKGDHVLNFSDAEDLIDDNKLKV